MSPDEKKSAVVSVRMDMVSLRMLDTVADYYGFSRGKMLEVQQLFLRRMMDWKRKHLHVGEYEDGTKCVWLRDPDYGGGFSCDEEEQCHEVGLCHEFFMELDRGFLRAFSEEKPLPWDDDESIVFDDELSGVKEKKGKGEKKS